MSVLFPVVPWANGTNIYEVNLRQYSPEGTLNAFAKHLPRLKDMGIQVIWFIPLTPISVEKRQGSLGSYYAASSYLTIDPLYGTRSDFVNLVKAAHELGMKVLIDWVANHTGYDHEWTLKHPDFYHKDKSGNFTGMHGWIDVIDLDYTNVDMRREMINSMQYWITQYDIDGFRCDMARTVPLDFWKEAREACDTLKPLLWLAECEVEAYLDVFDITYGWMAMRTLDKYFSNRETALRKFTGIIKKYAKQPAGTHKLLFTSNHDENTYYGTEYEKYGPAAKAVAVFTCTWPGIPLIYSGQELPNTKRLSFFEKDPIEWTGIFDLHNFYKKLFGLRSRNTALQPGAKVSILKTSCPDILSYTCRKGADMVWVLLNFGTEKVDFTVISASPKGIFMDLFTNVKVSFTRGQAFSLKGGEYKVYYSPPGIV